MTVSVVEAAAEEEGVACGDGREIALLDVREAGQVGEAHAFLAVPLPYSRPSAMMLPARAPNARAGRHRRRRRRGRARRVEGERAGGTRACTCWAGSLHGNARATHCLLGSTSQQSVRRDHRDCPSYAADYGRRVGARAQQSGEKLVIVDGRPCSEYQRMSIPVGCAVPTASWRCASAMWWRIARHGSSSTARAGARLHHRCADADRPGHREPGLCTGERNAGLVLAGLELERGAQRRYPDAGGAGSGHGSGSVPARP